EQPPEAASPAGNEQRDQTAHQAEEGPRNGNHSLPPGAQRGMGLIGGVDGGLDPERQGGQPVRELVQSDAEKQGPDEGYRRVDETVVSLKHSHAPGSCMTMRPTTTILPTTPEKGSWLYPARKLSLSIGTEPTERRAACRRGSGDNPEGPLGGAASTIPPPGSPGGSLRVGRGLPAGRAQLGPEKPDDHCAPDEVDDPPSG